MNSSRVSLHPAFVLHSRPYRDTSLLLDIFTEQHGRIAAIARGAKQPRSKFNGILQPFTGLLVSWSGTGDLVTLTAAEQAQRTGKLQGNAMLAAFYLNELLIQLMQRHDPHPELYKNYRISLSELSEGKNNELTLRRFECYLLQEIGYGLILDHDVESGEPVQPDRYYCYHPEHGPVITDGDAQESRPLVVQGKTLLALQSGAIEARDVFLEAKHFMRAIIHHQLGGRPIKTRELKLNKVL
ncbi:MAG: DNA repair protein RecO [Gammaproteobacteria bacterium]|nr:DNA repair protein RecO [Gammaproteobacteria bacterium]